MTLADRAGLVGAILAVAACDRGPSSPRATLAEVKAHQRAWNGRTVWVDGWINGCGGYDCTMYASEHDAVSDWRHIQPGTKRPTTLGIASDPSSWLNRDVQLDRLGLRHILLKARVDAECAQNECYDRAPDLHPITFKVLPNTQPSGN